jgi:hypothetical protein
VGVPGSTGGAGFAQHNATLMNSKTSLGLAEDAAGLEEACTSLPRAG